MNRFLAAIIALVALFTSAQAAEIERDGDTISITGFIENGHPLRILGARGP